MGAASTPVAPGAWVGSGPSLRGDGEGRKGPGLLPRTGARPTPLWGWEVFPGHTAPWVGGLGWCRSQGEGFRLQQVWWWSPHPSPLASGAGLLPPGASASPSAHPGGFPVLRGISMKARGLDPRRHLEQAWPKIATGHLLGFLSHIFPLLPPPPHESSGRSARMWSSASPPIPTWASVQGQAPRTHEGKAPCLACGMTR